jgi:predicted SAM-dependent methyltransferase
MNQDYAAIAGRVNNEEYRDSIMEDIYDMFSQGEINLNLGAGDTKLKNCINCDLYDPAADRKLDGRNLSEFKDGSVNAIYSCHFFEHLSYAEAHTAIKDWNRALRYGGHVIIAVPDMEEVIDVIYKWSPRPPEVWKAMMQFIYGWQEEVGQGQVHKWGWSCDALMVFLKQQGFRVRRVYRGYPRRPTPSIMVIAEKNGG